MGSDKYPGENEFDSFVSSHGGSTNAFTGYEMVSYSVQQSLLYLFIYLFIIICDGLFFIDFILFWD